jgi:cysteine desulfurase
MITPMPVYLDCAATTPVDPRVRAEMLGYFDAEFGNAGSRTHPWGLRARAAVEQARDRIAAEVGARRGDVIFTSGATESNNLAILGLAATAERRRHVVSTAIEHHAVLEPLAELGRRGFEITLVGPNRHGIVEADAVLAAVRADTLLISVMHVNNETGAIQPIPEIADRLQADAYFHVDAAQSFARDGGALRHPRIDLISASAHKINGPKGVGALVTRRRGQQHPPLEPLMFGGGQERGLRPGTMPVALVAGFGLAAELASVERDDRTARCVQFRASLLSGLAPLDPIVNGDPERTVPYIVNLSFPGLEAEVVIDAWRDLVGISNGAACTSQSYTCSHVLSAMGVPPGSMDGAVRLSWCAMTAEPDWPALVAAVEPYRSAESGLAGRGVHQGPVRP